MIQQAPPSDYGGFSNASKRLLSKTGGRRCVRGELLTNGYKSLRAQGMLKAVKVDSDNIDNNQPLSRKGSKELEHVNICIA